MNFSAEPSSPHPGYAEIFGALPHATLVVARDGIICDANMAFYRALEDISGQDCPEGRALWDVFTGNRSDILSRLFAAASGALLTLRFAAADSGRPEVMSFRVTALGQQRRAEHFLLCRDESRSIIRAFKGLNLQIAASQLTAEARQRHVTLQESYDELETFSYHAAHDLKAPLRNIDTLLSLLEDDHGTILPSEGRTLIQEARGCAVRLQSLIKGLIEHARSGSGPLHRQPVGIAGTVATVAANLSTIIGDTGGRIDMDDALGTVSADPALFHQLLENLIGNAFKYRAPDRAPVVTIRRGAALTVSDNGIGFAESEAEKLFEPFQRLHSHAEIEGSGIGLATCKRICERHGWTITATGTPGKGATFAISGIS